MEGGGDNLSFTNSERTSLIKSIGRCQKADWLVKSNIFKSEVKH